MASRPPNLRRADRSIVAALLATLAVVLVGIGFLARYPSTPGATGAAPLRWPVESALPAPDGTPGAGPVRWRSAASIVGVDLAADPDGGPDAGLRLCPPRPERGAGRPVTRSDRIASQLEDLLDRVHTRRDRGFAVLQVVQWVLAMGFTRIGAPYTWSGALATPSLHLAYASSAAGSSPRRPWRSRSGVPGGG